MRRMRLLGAAAFAAASCGGEPRAPTPCERFVAVEVEVGHLSDERDPRRRELAMCNQLVDGGPPPLDSTDALVRVWIDCAQRYEGDDAYLDCWSRAAVQVLELERSREALAEIHATKDRPDFDPVGGCVQLRSVLEHRHSLSDLRSVVAPDEAQRLIAEADGPLCSRDVWLHYARTRKHCWEVAAALAQIDEKHRDDPEVVAARADPAAQCPD